MNDTIPKAEQWLRDHDAEVHAEGRREAVAEIRDRLIGFVARLKEAAQTQLEAVNLMETMLMDKPATPVKRHRTRFKAIKTEVDSVKHILSSLGETLPVEEIARMSDLDPRIASNACAQLEAQGWIRKFVGDRYQWISEREAEEMNGPRMIDDIKEQDDV